MKIYDAHAHIYPAKIADKAVAAIGSFYGIPMAGGTGTADDLIASGSQIGVSKYLVHSTATNPQQVRAINDYTIKSSNRYSIYGIFEYLIECATEKQREVLEHMKVLYKMCHGYTHGSAEYVKYPLLQYFEISAMIYYVITNVFVDIHRELKSEISPDDKELLNMLDRDFSILFEQHSNRSTDNFELYYSIHKS